MTILQGVEWDSMNLMPDEQQQALTRKALSGPRQQSTQTSKQSRETRGPRRRGGRQSSQGPAKKAKADRGNKANVVLGEVEDVIGSSG